jgi:hypothetical protein
MKIARSAENNGTTFGHTFLFIRPFARELDPRFDGLSPGIHWQDHVIAKNLGNFLCESTKDGIVKCPRRQSETLSLLHQGCYNAWVAVALIYGAGVKR